MSNIYKFTDPKTGEDKYLVSKEYVDLRFKALKEALSGHIKNVDTAHIDHTAQVENSTVLDKVQVFSLDDVINSDTTSAENVVQDTNHRFVSDSTLRKLNSKPSVHEMNVAINDAKNDLQAVLNDQYVKLLNLKDALPKLREVAELVRDDINLSKLISALYDKVSKADLDEHSKSYLHITEKEREALIILLQKYDDGTLESLGNHSSNSDSADFAMDSMRLDGLDLKSVHKAKAEEAIIGLDGDYKEGEMDATFSPSTSNDILKLLYVSRGIFRFKPGVYSIAEWKLVRPLNYDDLIIAGCGDGTVFSIDTAEFGRIVFENCKFYKEASKSVITVSSHMRFKDVTFVNCDIRLNNSSFVTFKDCYFKDCNISFTGVCSYLKICDNYFDNSPLPKYITKNSVFSNNIEVR